jgi:hypothetical protein
MTFAFTIVLVLATWSVQAGVYHLFVLSMFLVTEFSYLPVPQATTTSDPISSRPGTSTGAV